MKDRKLFKTQFGILRNYSGLFLLVWIAVFLPFFLKGKAPLYMDDCITQHYVFLAQRKHILTEFLNNLKEFHTFSIPFVGYSLSMDDNIFSVIGIELTDLLFLLTDREHWEWLFVFAEMIRLWFSGLTFLLYMNCRKKGSEKDERSIIFSSLVYAFCGFGIVFSYKQPFFVSLLYHLPLLLLGIEKMIREDDRSLFILVTTFSAVCSLYLHYYATVVCIFYCIVRVFFTGIKKRDWLRKACDLVISYAVGFGISMFLNLHVIITLLESGKISKGIRNLSLTYGWQFFRNLVEGFFQIRVYPIHNTWTGMTPLFLPVLLFLFLRKGRKILKISLAAVFVLMNIPLMGTAAGISTTNNRWAYCLAFVCAYITCGILPEMIAEKDLKTEKPICILPIIFGVYLIFRNAGQKDAVLSAVCIIIAAVSWGLIPALKSIPANLPRLRNDGWASLEVANKFIRAHLPVKKKVYFKRGQRPRLRDFHVHGTAIICVYGHLIYVDHEEYYSFFDNLNDEVVCVWLLKELENGLKLV